MEKPHILGLGAFALLAAGVLAMRGPEAKQPEPTIPKSHIRLAALSTEAREDVDYAAIDRRLRRLSEQRSMVGLAVGIVENGRITFLKGYGETEAGSGDPVTPETVFRWASVSKGVAGTMVAKLAEEGKVNLNGPVGTYVPSLKLPAGAENRATVGDMLSHRLGLYRNAYDNKLEEGQDSKFLRQTLAQLNLICPPGTCWSYQNVAYDGASELVEQITHLTYERAVKQMLFNPIGMADASVSMNGLTSAKSWAKPHDAGRRPLELKDAYYRVPAAGGVNSDIKDMSLWMIAQMGEMPDVLSSNVLDTVHAPLVKTPGERGRLRKFLERLGEADYGYGWRSYDYAGHHIVGHRGGVAGYRSLILFDPTKKSGVVALWNSNTNQPGGLEFEIMDMIYGLEFRDWMELDKAGRADSRTIARAESEEDISSGDGNGGRQKKRARAAEL
ncbi:MAG: beta-lactamase family protein [Sphingomonas sp.]|nr:beta-lactamase family protein [Sphingomonas sp.]